jgi:hypothetical protein
LLSALMVALLLVLWPLALYAGEVEVDGTGCTLPNAITAANTNTSGSGCTISGTAGTETLLLMAASYDLIHIAIYNANGPNATPSITSNIVISSYVVGGSTVQRTGAANARLFHVAAAGDLTLRGVTVQNGNSGSTSHGERSTI